MQTKFLSTLAVTFNPFSATRWHKTPRLLLSFLPANAASSGLKISTTILPQNSTDSSRIAIGYKDGKTLVFEGKQAQEELGTAPAQAQQSAVADGVLDLKMMGVKDVLAEVDRHSRLLSRKADLE